MFTTILISWAVSSTVLACLLGRQAIKYKSEKLLFKSENYQLSDRLYDAVEGEITDLDIDFYLQNHGLMHDWSRKANSKVEWKSGSALYSDTLRTDMCRRCGLTRRYWVHGIGRDRHLSAAGCFRNGVRIENDGTNIKCCESTEPPKYKIKLLPTFLPKRLTGKGDVSRTKCL